MSKKKSNKIKETKKEPEKESNKIKSKDRSENMNQDNIVFYGDSSKVNAVDDFDYNDHIKRGKSSQNLKGFDDRYNDFVDYILTITHNIWEEKGIGIIYDTYHNNVIMHTGSNHIKGIQSVISGTLQTLHSFPDRKLIGQNVIWSKDKKDGYLSSHRIMSTATNLRDSNFGPATNKKVNFRTAVDCAAKNNRIYEEWLVRDNLWIIKQLGFDPHEVAKAMADKERQSDSFQDNFGIDESVDGQLFPERYQAKDESVGEFMKEMLNRIYKCKLFNQVKDYYAENAVIHYICNKDLSGYDQIQGMLVSLFASFPSANYSIDRITCNQKGDENEWDVAVRWKLRGLNEGRGFFGEPTSEPVEILGISHFHVKDNEILEEWVTFDGLDVLKQIYLNKEDKTTDLDSEE